MSPGDALVQAFFEGLGTVLSGFFSTAFSAMVSVFAGFVSEVLKAILDSILAG